MPAFQETSGTGLAGRGGGRTSKQRTTSCKGANPTTKAGRGGQLRTMVRDLCTETLRRGSKRIIGKVGVALRRRCGCMT